MPRLMLNGSETLVKSITIEGLVAEAQSARIKIGD